ncbi:MAG: SulP family inorganic anion transporter [Bacteroidetes bacterium]|nr:SulP family inorganic anion transporter [Bacteroidota bacterium]
MNGLFKYFKDDLPASIVVFFVALPLCLGIALASGAPLFAGIIAGIIGGIVVGSASGSPLGVSGPAAGLAVIVLGAIGTLGWEAFLLAVVLAGILQIIMGYAKLGIIAYYFPSSVIKGMLTGIGLIIILKQIPHALGYDADYEGDLSFVQPDGQTTFSVFQNLQNYITPAAVLISVISMFILIFWESAFMKKFKAFKLIQGPLVAVATGIGLNMLFQSGTLPFSLSDTQVVKLPVAGSISEFLGQFTTPDLSAITNIDVYITAFVLAIIASLETLLCVEATDKLDPYKRVTPTNQELKAQGLGNIFSGLIGGLPVTQVIVRSSANISFGGRTKLSAILHGFFLLACAVSIPNILNLIPLATLACILLVVGYKLAKPIVFKQQYKLGWEQFIPFMATIVGILFTDLLKGIAIGMAVGIFIILRHNYRNPFYFNSEDRKEGAPYDIILSDEVTFLNKGSILQQLNNIPDNSTVVLDGTRSKVIDFDVREIVRDFYTNAGTRNITVEIKGFKLGATELIDKH